MKSVNKNDNIKRSSLHLKKGCFLSKQWGEAQTNDYSFKVFKWLKERL